MLQEAIRPYIMDLGTVNGTFINGERIESERFYELLIKVRIRKRHLGLNLRRFVMANAKSSVLTAPSLLIVPLRTTSSLE